MRRPGGLGKDPVRAERRAAELAAIDPDWNPAAYGATVDWQRQYAYLAQFLDDGALLPAILPGVTRHGEDVGRWLPAQRRHFGRLNAEQQRLARLGVTAAAEPRTTAARATATTGRSAAALQTELDALAQYLEAEGRMPSLSVVQTLPDGSIHRTGVWLTNQRGRRDRLDAEQLAALGELGLGWAR
ncbi:helicase associated domain-containing protein [Streptomyces sp. NPDC048507]|uniref:helicase associated domain-containing protein n=1 Tax=Streptomyces sp. NPDC048507 TaxID=3365560 RepID=UPI003719A4DE